MTIEKMQPNNHTEQPLTLRQINSFVLRQGKMTRGQRNALSELMPHYGIPYNKQPLTTFQIFGNNNPLVVEIGFGMGDATWQIAKTHPNYNYLGIEVHGPGVGSLLMHIAEEHLHNIKVVQYDAVAVITNMLHNSSVQGFHIFFPDPWPKKRHHKRRIIQAEFVELLVNKLTHNGYIHLATDWEDYAQHMLTTINNNPQLKHITPDNQFIAPLSSRPITKFEQRGHSLGHKIWDLVFSRNYKPHA